MIKLVPVDQLVSGVYIHDLNCDWWEHPFARSQFRLNSDAEIEKIRAAGLHEVYIDTDKGVDIGDHVPTQAEVHAAVEQQMLEVATQTAVPRHRTLAEEQSHAAGIHHQAHRAVRAAMQDARLGAAIQMEGVEAVVEAITGSILRNSSAMLGLLCIKNKDEYTFLHCVGVCTLMVTFAQSLGLSADECRQGGIGGLLHDVGKAFTPDEILNKPGPLTEAEFETMKRHPVDGFGILQPIDGIQDIPLQITLRHHERLDSSGYPGHWPADQISQLVRMASIVDVYDAITADRCYHRGIPPTEALRKLFEWSKYQFDPVLVKAFMRCVGIYPVGSLVRLESGRLGVVIEQNEANLLTPRIRVFFSIKANTHVQPTIVDLSRPLGHGGADRITGFEDPEKWKVEPQQFMGL